MLGEDYWATFSLQTLRQSLVWGENFAVFFFLPGMQS